MRENKDEGPEVDPENGPDDEGGPQSADAEPGDSREGEDVGRAEGFRMPAGFAQSLLPNTNGLVAKIVAPWQKQIQERLKSLLPDTSAYTHELMEPLNRST